MVFGICAIWTFCSCKKIIEVKSSTNIDNATAFSDDLSAITAAMGMYGESMKIASPFNGQLTRYPCMYGDDITRPFINNATDNPFLTNQLQPNNTTVKEVWNAFYYYVFIANTILENLKISNGVTLQTKRQLEGEAKFFRALIYFYLVNLFGDVPLVLETNTSKTSNLKRAPEKEVYGQMKADLLDAVLLLPLAYPKSYTPPADRVRANKGAAAALLARVYLYLHDYSNAIDQSSWVINCGLYKLESLDNVYLSKSNETIFALYPTNITYNTVEGRIFGGTSSKPVFVLTDALLKTFNNKDARAIKWMKTVSTTSGPVKIPYKYKVYESDQVLEYDVILRLAEMYLIRAEAFAGIGSYREAINDLNIIRNRASIELLPDDLNVNQLKDTIEVENQHEFFAELGHRWLDLRRWQGNSNSSTEKHTRADEVLRINKISSWEPYKQYWPIPRDEILRSPGLIQNPGYGN